MIVVEGELIALSTYVFNHAVLLIIAAMPRVMRYFLLGNRLILRSPVTFCSMFNNHSVQLLDAFWPA